MDKAKLKDYLATLHNPSRTTKEFAATRLQQIRGKRKDIPTPKLQTYVLMPFITMFLILHFSNRLDEGIGVR